MIAFKFLRQGRLGPFSGFQWPEPGIWVHTDGQPALCRRGVHACRPRDLPWWLADELWEIELDGEVQVGRRKLTAVSGRLRSPVAAWTPARGQKFAEACAWRARDQAVRALEGNGRHAEGALLRRSASLEAIVTHARRLAGDVPAARISLTMAADGAVRALGGAIPTSAYIAAHAAHRLDGPSGYAREREWQARWLVRELGLGVTPWPVK
jgi:hypothetical protein